jgi:hypothetical protein
MLSLTLLLCAAHAADPAAEDPSSTGGASPAPSEPAGGAAAAPNESEDEEEGEAGAALPLHAGELNKGFYTNAYQMRAGELTLHPGIWDSQWGITDKVELRSSILGFIPGPNLGLKVGVLQSKEMALAVEVDGSADWKFKSPGGGGGLVWSYGGPTGDRVNVGVGASYGKYVFKLTDETGNIQVKQTIVQIETPITVGYDLALNDQQVFQFIGVADALGLSKGEGSAAASFQWNRGWEAFRLGLGLGLYYRQDLSVYTELSDKVPDWPVYPYPSASLWWRI